jgi:putative endonuclease
MHLNTKKIGESGEERACQFLEEKKYQILHKNWRFKHAEIDIIAKSQNIIVFVEVKFRKSNKFGYPEEFVSKHKIKKMHEAAAAYIETNNWDGELRFDIIAIEGNNIEHFEDAFYS